MMFEGGMILAWLFPIVGGYFLVKYLIDQNNNKSNIERLDPLTVLKQRFANGEIDQQELEERKRILLNI